MDTQQNLLAALIAVRNELISLDDVRAHFPQWQAQPQGTFLDWLAQQGKLSADDLPFLDSLLHHKLQQHHGDVQAGLDSFMPAGDWQALTPSQIATVGRATAEKVLPPAARLVIIPGRSPAKPPAESGQPRGRYVRLHLHAAGGIGQVFLARDTHLDRDVALKELKPEATQDPSMGWRFLKEAHITGQLEHPGIVPVYELVTDEQESAPYYVMRFLRGKTLSQAIQEYHLKRKSQQSALERARLLSVFGTVCQTVAFAHSRGIIHRDLKGANILLGDFGEVAVLDWGLAKKLDSTDESSKREKGSGAIDLDQSAEFERTLEGQVLGTPYYMSPEQAAGKSVDSRSDVYSLGAILYEILTGHPPFAEPGSKSLSIRELLQRIGTDAPIPPRQLSSDTPRALEAICVRALQKKPEERYVGAAELGQDIQRWLADEPVHAYPEPVISRLSRWARRNKALVASAAALLTATVVGLSIFTVLLNQEQQRTDEARAEAVANFQEATKANVQLVSTNEQLKLEKQRTDEARARAEANFKRAQDAVDQYLTKVSEERLLDEPGLQDLRRELLASALQFYADFAREQRNDPASRLALGDAQLKLAQIHTQLGERTKAIQVFEEARELFRDLVAKSPDVDTYRHHHAQSNHGLAIQVWRLKGPGGQAEELAEMARSELAHIVQRSPLPIYRNDLAEAHNTLAQILVHQGRTSKGPEADELRHRALSQQNTAVEIWQKLVDERPDNPIGSKSLAGGFGNLAALYDPVQQRDKIEQSLNHAMRLLEGLVEKHSKSIEYQMLLGGAYRNLGIHYGQRNAGKAQDYLRRAVDVRHKVARQNPHVPELQFRAADDYFQLANFLYIQGTRTKPAQKKLLAQAAEAYQRAIAIYQRLSEDYPDENRYLAACGQSLNGMGDVVYEESKPQAMSWYEQGIEKLEMAVKRGEKSEDFLRSLANAYEERALGRVREGRLQPALDDLDRAIELRTGDKRNELIGRRRAIRAQLVVELMKKRGDFEAAAKEIAKVTAEPLKPLEKLLWARHLAICADLADEKKSPLADQYAAEVVVLLNRAKKGGVFNDAANVKAVENLGRVVRALSRRPDFQELLRELKRK